MKLSHFHSRRLLHAAELLAIQGWDVGGLNFKYPKATFGSLQNIVGNGICVPVLGAVMCGLLAFVVPNVQGKHLLQPSGISFALGGVGFAPVGVAPAAAAEASASGSSSDSCDSDSESSSRFVLKALPPQRKRQLPRPVRSHMSQNQAQGVLLNPVARG